MPTTLDWNTVRPVTELSFVHGYVELPAFEVSGIGWQGASEIVRQYNYSASKNFTLRGVPSKPEDANYVLCIRFRRGNTVFRYKLWDDENAVLQAPLYVRQLIKKNFCLEIWSVNGQATASQATALTLNLTMRQAVTDFHAVPANFRDATGADAGSLMMTSSAPSSPVAGSAFWYKYDAGVVLSGADVTAWQDQSGNGRDLAPNAPGNEPVVGTVDFGNQVSLTGISFNGTAKNLQAAGVFLNLRHLFLVFKQDASTAGHVIFDSESNKLRIRQAAGNDIEFRYEGTDSAAVAGELAADYVLHVFRNETTGEVRGEVNGLHGLIADAQVVDESNLQQLQFFSLGGDGVTTLTADMWLLEVLGYDTALTAAQVVLVKQYLAGRYDTGTMILPITFSDASPWLDNV